MHDIRADVASFITALNDEDETKSMATGTEPGGDGANTTSEGPADTTVHQTGEQYSSIEYPCSDEQQPGTSCVSAPMKAERASISTGATTATKLDEMGNAPIEQRAKRFRVVRPGTPLEREQAAKALIETGQLEDARNSDEERVTTAEKWRLWIHHLDATPAERKWLLKPEPLVVKAEVEIQ
ncbi:hypothetical protein QFC24_002263 [Naganishia onofrii]|uniref:Uncharacterized protein n=1 Tax=Naganishia onofrii TaxID=1851511 RepID=A0ACC2XQT3_9TREE|nr:hypothetical protein QFC24_002263 [Naganishia onofrii]